MAKKLIKFEKNDCAPCAQVGEYLTKKGVKFQTINAFDQPHVAGKFKIMSVPVTLIIDEDTEEILSEKVIGFKPGALDNLIDQL